MCWVGVERAQVICSNAKQGVSQRSDARVGPALCNAMQPVKISNSVSDEENMLVGVLAGPMTKH